MADNVTKLDKDEAGSDKTKLPGREELMALRRQVQELKATLDEARGEMGALIKNADEKKNIHKGAFKLCNKLLNMSADKQDAFLTHFDHYRAKMGLDEGRSAELPFDGERVAAE